LFAKAMLVNATKSSIEKNFILKIDIHKPSKNIAAAEDIIFKNTARWLKPAGDMM
jgi:hypothetical protein